MPTRAVKRRKHNADEAVDDFPTDQLHVLIQSVLNKLQLKDAVKNESSLLRVRRAPPTIGIGVYLSDVAVRLFHAHGVRSTGQARATCDKEQESNVVENVFASSVELAAFCARVMEKTRQAECNTRCPGITRIAVPDDAARGAGMHADRVLIYTREFARLRTLETPLETPLENQIEVLFHDDAILVVHKPYGMLSVDGNGSGYDDMTTIISVQSLVREYYPEARMVHRLDQETSGILVVALTRSAAQHINQQFRNRTVDKTYIARVVGHVQGDHGVIELCIARSKTEKLVQRVVDDDDSDGAVSRTEWCVLERSDAGNERVHDPSTLMELKPVTGKTHQLRVHMQHLGHAILGDSLYSPERVEVLAPRLLLHAAAIQFDHPVTHERVKITCKPEF